MSGLPTWRCANRASPTCWAGSPRGSPSRGWRHSPPCSPTAWSWSSTSCRPAPTSSWSTPSGSAPAATTWWPPARSSSPRQLGQRGGRQRHADRPRGGLLPRPGRRASARRRPRARVVEHRPVHPRRGAGAGRRGLGPASGRGVPRRHRTGTRAGAAAACRRLARGAGHRGPRSCGAARRAAAATRTSRPASTSDLPEPPEPSWPWSPPVRWSTGSSVTRLRLLVRHRDRPGRASARRPRTCVGCRRVAGATVDPLQLARRRLRRPRAARRRAGTSR